MPLLSLDGCHVSFGAVRALAGVSLRVDRGEIVGVVGALGSGKTTLMRMVAGLVHPASGTVSFDDQPLGRMAWDARARSGVVHVPADGGFFPTLTVTENLVLAESRGAPAERRAVLMKRFPVIAARGSQYAGSLSGGEQRQLSIVRGALAAPRLLLLDEPLLGLSPVTARSVIALLGELRGNGVAILVAEERPTEDLETLADRIVGLRDGHVVPAAEIAHVPAQQPSPAGDLDHVDVEMLGVPMSTRDRRALQTIAQAAGVPVGELIARLLHEHVEQQRAAWR